MRVLLGAFGDPGHAFPMIALGRALVAREHDVTLQTWRRWERHVREEGMRFAPAPEYTVFPSGGPGSAPLDFYEAVVHATSDTLPLVRELRPDVAVADILTLAPALAAEIAGVPRATLIPHVHPHGLRDFPIYSLGARLPRTAAGRAFWRAAHPLVERGLERGRVELNATRARVGLQALDYVHGGISRELALVATFPQLEYPRPEGGDRSSATDDGRGPRRQGPRRQGPRRQGPRGQGPRGQGPRGQGPRGQGPSGWGLNAHVVGPLMWEPPAREVPLPRGRAGVGAAGGRVAALAHTGAGADAAGTDAPLVLIAPSTAQDAEHALLRAALRGLARAPVRVLATYNRRLPQRALRVPENASVVDWVSYSRTMPHCDVVVCHAGHGTLVRALSCGCAVVACPAVGDMSENAARVDWAGAGVRVPRRFLSPRTLRLAVDRALADPAIRTRAQDLASWARAHDAGTRAAMLVERLASQ